MPFIDAADAPHFELHGASFIGLAAPSRGATETAAWIVTLAPGTTGVPHRLTREEVFIALDGAARATVGDRTHELRPGCALVVPAGTELRLDNPSDAPFRAVAMLPVGGQALLDGQEAFTPAWAR